MRVRGPFRPGGAGGRDFGGGIADLARPELARRSPARSRRASARRHALHDSRRSSSLPVHPAPSLRPSGGSRLTLSSNGRQSSRSAIAAPDRLDLVDMHRAGLGVRPIWVRQRDVRGLRAAGASSRNGFARIGFGSGVAAAAPVEEDAVDRLRRASRAPDQRGGDFRHRSAAARRPSRRSMRVDQRLLERGRSSRRARPTVAAPRRRATGSRRAGPGPSGSPRAGGRTRRGRNGRNRRR